MQTLRRRQTEAGEDLRLAGRWRRCLSALATRATYEPLRQDAAYRRRQKVRLDPHIGKARYGADRIVGVQGRQNQVPGEARLNRDLRGFEIADFSDHDDVGVLAQNR